MAAKRKRRLGRGLDGLLPPREAPASSAEGSPPPLQRVALERIRPNPTQPRRRFPEASLRELADSIREHGLLEPIVVRRAEGEPGEFVIVAGERRWRAARMAGLQQVPVFVRELSDPIAFEAALVENLQREDLTPVEAALAFRRLREEHGYSTEQLARRLGKSRVAVTNTMRLLRLPAEVLSLVDEGRLSEGHARALLGLQDPAAQRRLAEESIRQGWSVREVERQVRRARAEPERATLPGKRSPAKSPNVRALERRLAERLGTPVEVADRGGKGRLVLHYGSLDELDRLLERLGVR